MKIGSIDNKAVANAPANERKANGQARAGAEPSAKVELSSAAALGGASAEFDAAKVERIAQAIRDGSYKINAEAIADKLIANAAELLGKPNQ